MKLHVRIHCLHGNATNKEIAHGPDVSTKRPTRLKKDVHHTRLNNQ